MLLLPWVGAKGWRSRQAIRRHWRLLLALGATGIAAFHTLVYIALRDSSAIDALLMLSLTPVAILGGSALVGGARPTASQWAGSAASLLGAAILLTHGEPARWAKLGMTQGTLCMLLAVILWAAYTLCLRRRPRELAHDVLFAASIVPAPTPARPSRAAARRPARCSRRTGRRAPTRADAAAGTACRPPTA